MKKNMKKLRLLNDNVITDEDDDHLGHKLYAELLASIFHPDSGNKSGISVGLFGKWGQGKSCIVEMLRKKLEKNNQTKTILFNAWKTRGDHVRRQLMLNILKGVESPRYNEISKFIQPGNPLKIRPYNIQKDERQQTHWWVMSKNEELDKIVVGAIIAGVLSIVVFIILAIIAMNINENRNLIIFCLGTLITFISSCVTVVFRWFVNRKEQILTSAEPVSDSQRLKFPDQFQRVFEEELADYKTRDKTPLLIIIDDLDRCDASTIVEALTCVRQLNGEPIFVEDIASFRFLIPCDEKQVVNALEKDGHQEGYKNEELLRKFFDVTLRMDSMIQENMVRFVEDIAKHKGNQEIIAKDDILSLKELVGAVAPNDPRFTKKLINAYLVSIHRINTLIADKRLPPKIDLQEFTNTHLAVIALRESVPGIFDQFVHAKIEWKSLQEEDLENPKTKDGDWLKAVRIIHRLEPTYARTARWLAEGGKPKDMLEVTNSYEIINAFKSENTEAFLNEIGIAEEKNEGDKVCKWLDKQRNQILAASSLKGVLSLLILLVEKYKDTENHWSFSVLGSFLKSNYTSQALNAHDQLPLLSSMLHLIDASTKNKCCKYIIDNFYTSSAPSESQELKSVFWFANELSGARKTRLERTISKIIYDESNNAHAVKEIISGLLAVNKALKHVPLENYFGFSPKLAKEIAEIGWSKYEEMEFQEGLFSNIIINFIGEDEATSVGIINTFIGDPLLQPIDIAGMEPGKRGVLLEVFKIISNFSSNIKQFEALKEDQAKLINWLVAQTTSSPEHIILICETLQHFVPYLYASQQKQLLKSLNELISIHSKSAWVINYVSKAFELSEDKGKYHEFCLMLFKEVDGYIRQVSTLPDECISFFKEVAKTDWQIQEMAEQLLEFGIQQNIITTQEIADKWILAFAPLCKGHRDNIKKVLFGKIKQNVNPDVAIYMAKALTTKGKIIKEFANVLSGFIFSFPEIAFTSNEIKDIFDNDVDGYHNIISDLCYKLDVSTSDELIEFCCKNAKFLDSDPLYNLLILLHKKYLLEEDPSHFKHLLNLHKNIPKTIQPIKDKVLELQKTFTGQYDGDYDETIIQITKMDILQP